MSLFTDLKEVLTPYASRIKSLDSQVGEVNESLGVINFVKDYYINTSTTPINLTPVASSAGRKYAVIDCSPGDKFVINAYSDYGAVRAWCFIDNSNNAVSMADANVTVTDLELTAPANAVKLIINDMNDGMSYKVGNNLANRIAAIEKGGSGLSDGVKIALLDCFRNIALWNDGNGEDCIAMLEAAFNNVADFYNRYSWKFSDDSFLSTVTGVWDTIDGNLGINNQATRRSLYSTIGKWPCKRAGESASNKYYPIPIPAGATKANISLNPATMIFASTVWQYNENTRKYQVVSGSSTGWVTGSVSLNLPSGNNLALIISYRYSDNRSMSEDVGINSISLTFE